MLITRLTIIKALTSSILLSLIYFLVKLFTTYTSYLDNGFENYYNLNQINYLGHSLFFTGILTGFLVLLISDTRVFFNKIISAAILIIFFCIIWFFINECNFINLFFLYEMFLIPSFFLVYYLSPNRRSIIASIYFLTWTQFGSLLVLMSILLIFYQTGSFYFKPSIRLDSTLIYSLLFFGFGIKIPMWPFYYWLTKTHVEASSFFSIYLSGFLVKTAVFLFIKFYSLYGSPISFNWFLILFLIGIIDSSIKMWHQTDLKKLIAYTTVQEMNFLCIPILWNDAFSEIILALFIMTHCLLSSIFFLYIDIITKRYNTRVTTQINGLVHTMPLFTLCIFVSWVLFSGLPYTIKFLLELGIFNILYHHSNILCLVIIIAMNFIGILGFSKNIFNSLFGTPILSHIIAYDLTRKELYLFTFMIFCLVLLNFSTLLIC